MHDLNDRIILHPFFHGMQPAHLATLRECAREARFKPGDLLFREGEPAAEFFLIEEGSICLEAHAPAGPTLEVQQLGPGEALGWSWLFPPFTWHFRARALTPASAIVFNGAHLLIAAENDHDFGFQLMKRVAHLAIQRLQATRKQWLASHPPSTSPQLPNPASRQTSSTS
jgi:CRP/FNR family transcriptional regulator, cyclic AMP receptor protein